MQGKKYRMVSGGGVHAREEGVVYDDGGRIVISRAGLHGIDDVLWDVLRVAVDRLFITINLAAIADDGATVTIGKVGPADRVCAPVTAEHPDVIRLAEYLRVHGFHIGADRSGPHLLLGPPHTHYNPTDEDHTHQLQVVLPRPCPAALADDGVWDPDWDMVQEPAFAGSG